MEKSIKSVINGEVTKPEEIYSIFQAHEEYRNFMNTPITPSNLLIILKALGIVDNNVGEKDIYKLLNKNG